MAALVSIDEVQSWLSEDRLQLSFDNDLGEEVNISLLVRAALHTAYDTSSWVDRTTTPSLVRKVIAARVASVLYRKVYADQADELPYADWLNGWADDTLEGIANGTLRLLDVVTTVEADAAQVARSIAFKPNDATATADVEDATKFTIGQIF